MGALPENWHTRTLIRREEEEVNGRRRRRRRRRRKVVMVEEVRRKVVSGRQFCFSPAISSPSRISSVYQQDR